MSDRHVVLITGGRDYRKVTHVWLVLDQLNHYKPITRVVQGGATGADGAARGWATSRGVECTTVDADWNAHGRAAGPIRNQRMLDEHEPDVVVAFPGGRGTKDMVTRAKACGFRVELHEQPGSFTRPARVRSPNKGDGKGKE